MLKPYQERVVEEKRELDMKIRKLSAFLKTVQVDSEESARLSTQLKCMTDYSSALEDRIDHFNT